MKRLAICAAVLALAACAQTTNPQPQVTEQRPVPLIKTPIHDGGTGLVGPGSGALPGSLIGAGNGAKASALAGLAIGHAVGGSSEDGGVGKGFGKRGTSRWGPSY